VLHKVVLLSVMNLILKKLYNPWPGKIYNNYNTGIKFF